MQLAAERLCADAATVAEIAEAVGYASESAFNRAFRKLVGVPPATWRRSRPGAA